MSDNYLYMYLFTISVLDIYKKSVLHISDMENRTLSSTGGLIYSICMPISYSLHLVYLIMCLSILPLPAIPKKKWGSGSVLVYASLVPISYRRLLLIQTVFPSIATSIGISITASIGISIATSIGISIAASIGISIAASISILYRLVISM